MRIVLRSQIFKRMLPVIKKVKNRSWKTTLGGAIVMAGILLSRGDCQPLVDQLIEAVPVEKRDGIAKALQLAGVAILSVYAQDVKREQG